MPFRPRRVALALLASLWLAGGTFAAEPSRAVPGEVLVRFRPGARAADRASLRNDLGARRLGSFPFIDVEHLKFDGLGTDEAIARLRADPRVLYAEPNYEIHLERTPNDSLFSHLYALRNTGQTGGTAGADIHAISAWDVFTGDSTLKIGCIDTGIDYHHPDLAPNIWTNPGEIPDNGVDDDGNGYVDDVHGYDFVNNDGDPDDDNGHGTHTAGTIAAVGDNRSGVTGVTWRAQLVAIKFLNSGGSGTIAAAVAAIQYAVRVGCRVTNNSWGGASRSQALLDAISAAGEAGQLFVAAAGNSGEDIDVAPSYPASFDAPWVITVAATDDNDELASFSNRGATSVDLAAPGVRILSTLPGDSYGVLSGTSMAAPYVTGAVALAMGRFPDRNNLQIKSMLLGAADPIPLLAGTSVTGARLDAFALVATPDSTPPGSIADLSIAEPGSNDVRLGWTATGDDGAEGRASRYEIRYSTSPITSSDFGSATPAPGSPDPHPSGSPESFTVTGLSILTRYWFAVRALDEFGNPGPVSNVVDASTLGAPRGALAPDSIAATLTGGEVAHRTLMVSNVAAGALDFTFPTPPLAFEQVSSFSNLEIAKGEDGPPGPPAVSGFGGPDGGGYRWVDSDEVGGPRFEWVELSDSVSPVILNGDDFLSAPLPLGFRFPFYGQSFDAVRVCTNGFLTFTERLALFGNVPLPGPSAPSDLIAPFWDDLQFGATPRVYARCEPTRCIIEYVAVPHYRSGGPYTFEVILQPTGEIRFQYLSMGEPRTSATVGLQDGTRRVGLNVAYNTTYVHDSLAIRLAPLPQWVTVAPAAARVHAGESLPLDVRLDATGLPGGRYEGTLRMESNDPDAPVREVPVALHVIGAPDLVLTPGALDFDSVFVGARPARTLRVSNPGTDVLRASVTASDPSVTVEPSSFELERFDVRDLTVRWAPAATGPLDASLTFTSNDPDTPVRTLPLSGLAIPAPSFAVEPESLAFAILSGGAATGSLRVTNRGGSDFVFRAATLTGASDLPVTAGARGRAAVKGATDDVAGPAPLDHGGPDGFGYTFRDSREPGGPAFAWDDVRATGVGVDLVGDDAVSAAVPIGFGFPFYGRVFDSLRVSTNGFVSFTSTAPGFSNTPLPNDAAGVPENLLAAFWDDLVFPSGRHAFVRPGADGCVIQFQDVPRFAEAAYPNTFEIVLHPGGEIDYRYLAVRTPNPRSATVGIQDETRSDGLQVAYNAPYLADSLAVRFDPPARWLTVSPREGRVPPGGSLDVAVGINTAGVFAGSYAGRVRFDGNDPLAPRHDVLVRLEVAGVPVAAAEPVSLDFGRVSIGEPRTLPLTVRNDGSDSLRIEKIEVDDPRFAPEIDGLTLGPFERRAIGITFAPPSPGPAAGRLTLRSNDPDHPALGVSLAAAGVPPQRLELAPDSVREALATTLGPEALEQTRRLVVANRGGNDLEWNARALLGVSIAALNPPLDAEGAKGEPGEFGALGAAGPDAGGYRWIDSDEAGAPSFDWIDIRGTGHPLPFDGDDQTSPAIPLPFPFEFYGTRFDSIRVCTNGWASFTSRLTTFTNAPLPNAGRAVPENLLAAFWDDQDFSPSVGYPSAFTFGDSSRFVIAFHDVPHQAFGGLYTYEIVLHRDGSVDYQYLTMGTRLTEATIGIQNGDRSIGLQVASNARYVHDRLRVHLTRMPPWLAISRAAGRVPPGGADTLEVALSAAGLPDGDLRGAIRIESGDRLRPLTDVPVALHVGVAAGECRLTPRTLNPSRGGPYAQLRVSVPGVDPRRIEPASLRVNGTIEAAPGQPVQIAGDAAVFRIRTLDLAAAVTVGPVVPIRVTARAAETTWFTVRDTLRLSRPSVRSPEALHAYGSGLSRPSFTEGERLSLAWEGTPGVASDRWELWRSMDAGRSWTLAAKPAACALEWTVPGPPADSALIEIAGYAGEEVVESFVSGVFRILPAAAEAALPRALALRHAGAHPARGPAALELALPVRTEVEVRIYDLLGAVVRRIELGPLDPGLHRFDWDGADAAGRPARPGVYFVRATAAGRTATLRIALIR